MRRPLAAATLLTAATAVLLAGCSPDRPGSGAAGTAAPAPAPSVAAVGPAGGSTGGAPAAGSSADAGAQGDAALSGNTGAICAQAAKTGVDFAATFAANVKLQIEAASAGEPGAVQRAEEKAARDVRNYSYALKDMAKLAADPALKKALNRMGDRVTALKGDVSTIDETELTGLRATLDEACGTK